MNRFHCDCRLQVYIYSFMYVKSDTMAEEVYFLATKIFVANYKKNSTPVPVPKIVLDLGTYVENIISYI